MSTILSGFGYNNVMMSATSNGMLYLADSSTDSIFQAGDSQSGWWMNAIAGGTTGDLDGACCCTTAHCLALTHRCDWICCSQARGRRPGSVIRKVSLWTPITQASCTFLTPSTRK